VRIFLLLEHAVGTSPEYIGFLGDGMSKSERTFKKILDAIDESVRFNGEQETNYRSVASIAKLSQATIVKYIPRKKDLLLTLAQARVNEVILALEKEQLATAANISGTEVLNVFRNHFKRPNGAPSFLVYAIFRAHFEESFLAVCTPMFERLTSNQLGFDTLRFAGAEGVSSEIGKILLNLTK
jgi:AcrR family transcriptional regulator